MFNLNDQLHARAAMALVSPDTNKPLPYCSNPRQAMINQVATLTNLWTTAIGCYEGKREFSVVVELDDGVARIDIILLGQAFKQDTILLLDPYCRFKGGRSAWLADCNTGENAGSLGTFKQVPENYALKQDAWTYVPNIDAYFVAE